MGIAIKPQKVYGHWMDMAMTAPSAAPDATPIRKGSAKRVAEQSLVGCPAASQRRAGQRDQDRARQPDPPQDGRGCLTSLAQKRGPELRGETGKLHRSPG